MFGKGFDENFWGEAISIYTDTDAMEDGIVQDVSAFGVSFNGKIINRVTVGAGLLLDLENKQTATTKNHLQFISDNSRPDGEDEDAWGIFEPHEKFGNEKLWLVSNEIKGYTLMLPEEY